MSIRPPSPRLSQSSPRHLSFFSLSPLFSCSTLYVSTCAKIKREREGEDLPINLPTYLPTYLPTGCYLVTRRGLRLYDSPAVDDVVAPGVGVISTREGTYPPITVTSFSPLLPTVSPFLFRSPSLPRFLNPVRSPPPSYFLSYALHARGTTPATNRRSCARKLEANGGILDTLNEIFF